MIPIWAHFTDTNKSLKLIKKDFKWIKRVKKIKERNLLHEHYHIQVINSLSLYAPAGPVLYDLYAICNHVGTVNMGHYTACCLDENGWCLYNDSRWDLCLSNLRIYLICRCILSFETVSHNYSSSHTNSVTSVSENQLQTNQAYVLFYQRSSSSSTTSTSIRK